MDTPERAFHGGNFHGQYVAMACDYMNIAVTEIGVLAERQLNRLVDPHLNGHLPPFLAKGQTGLFCGFEGAQYLATSLAAENLDLAAPSSIKSIPSNGSNQDVVSMGLTSARKAVRLTEHVEVMVSALIAACHQATFFLDREKLSPPIRRLHEELSHSVGEYRDDTPISDLLAKVRSFVTRNAHHYADGCVQLPTADGRNLMAPARVSAS
jgi:histidine ammonia-lyase/tyrosine ammonia-lyase